MYSPEFTVVRNDKISSIVRFLFFRLDREHIERAKTDDFELEGRPKQWKVKAWEGFKQTTANRYRQSFN